MSYKLLCALIAIVSCIGFVGAEPSGGAYIPTPQIVVDAMLDLAEVNSDDFIIDLGSGDGVIVLTAAQRFSARGLGVDINHELVRYSNSRAKELGVAHLAEFRTQDIFATDISDATVITLYLLPKMMEKLRPVLFNRLKPGARIVSHDYHLQHWMHDQRRKLSNVPEKVEIMGAPTALIYLWTVPERVAGRWLLKVAGNHSDREYFLNIHQHYQSLDAEITRKDQKYKVSAKPLSGANISFTLHTEPFDQKFTGIYENASMSGSVFDNMNNEVASWSATLLEPRGVVTTE